MKKLHLFITNIALTGSSASAQQTAAYSAPDPALPPYGKTSSLVPIG